MRRNLLFIVVLILLCLVSCQKEADLLLGNGGSGGTGGGGTGGGSSFPFYFIGTVGSTAIKYEANDINSTLSCGISQPENSLGFTDFDIYEGTVILNTNDFSKNVIRVHILKYFNHDPTAAERTAMIKIGSYPYGVGNVSSSTVNGASIDFIDANGNNWFSETGSQTGSTFTITELVTNTSGTSGKIFKANFSCKLYDINGTNSIQVTNATIRGKILTP